MSSNLSRINNILVICIVAINLYSLALPFAPVASFWVRRHTSDKFNDLNVKINSSSLPIPPDNRLVIPKMLLDEPIYDGQSIYTVNKGIWRRPATSTPASGSNTVLVGHRFTYHGAAIFYHLDVLGPGDDFVIYWQGRKYVYKVNQTKVVGSHDMTVEQPTDKPVVTLYTCTPLWTATNRLIITAERIN